MIEMAKSAGNCGKSFVVEPGKKFSLAKIDPQSKKPFTDKAEAKAQAARDAAVINQLQDRMYAERKQALLIVLQGIDCSGKDGTIRSVFNECGPIGVSVSPFKTPSEEEKAHDYLWRIHKAVPPKGFIGIFNRSHYEDVLVVRVKKLVPADVIERRYEEINRFEKEISDNGTRILKFMLYISKEEQAKRLGERVTDPSKQWKFNPSDLEDRALWDEFMAAYEIAVTRCSTPHAPWHVIPGNHHWVRNAAIACIVRETLEEMDPQYPKIELDPKTIKIV